MKSRATAGVVAVAAVLAVAMLSKLTGNVDPQKILDLAPGEMNNLPGFEAWNEGATSTLGEYSAYQLGGTWQSNGMKRSPRSRRDPGPRRSLRPSAQRRRA